MRFRALFAALMTVALGGCFESKASLWRIETSGTLPTGTGRYNCKAHTGHQLPPIDILARENVGYVYRGYIDERTLTTPMSVHNIEHDRYVFVLHVDTGEERGQVVFFAKMRRDAVDFFRVSSERREQLSEEFGVETTMYRVSGPTRSQRAFIEAMVREEPESIEATCTRV